MTQKYLLDAIQDKQVVSFTYLGSERVVEPYVLGLNADGQITLMAWQISGAGAIGWRNYLIDKMRCAEPTEQFFSDPRTGYSPDDLPLQKALAWVGAPVRSLDLFSGYC